MISAAEPAALFLLKGTISMIVILKNNPDKSQLDSLISWIKEKGLQVHMSVGENHTVLGLIGDTSKIDIDLISALDIVDTVKRVQEPYKNANPNSIEDTVIKVRDTNRRRQPDCCRHCSVESEKQIIELPALLRQAARLCCAVGV